ncbi:MAG TPA: cytidine deaminase [Xanthomonadales bacterium]|nr:cytidine deaminase [Xanthomonadales bacterium]
MGQSPDFSKIESIVEALKPAAVEACANAHVVYSNFPVGSALKSDNEAVFAGCNVENASYGLTICAERNALAQAVANGVVPGSVRELLIYTPGEKAHTPCGACRQVMQELLSDDAVIISCCDTDHQRSWGISDLMPDPFRFS